MRSVTDISVPQNEFICGFPVSEVNTDYILLYSFFWVIPQCSDFVCWLFGTLCPILYLSFRASKSIIYNKPTRCNSGSIVFINNYRYTTVTFWPWNSTVRNQPWTSIQDLLHPSSWQTPVTAVTVYSAPDDGRKGCPEHVEHTCNW